MASLVEVASSLQELVQSELRKVENSRFELEDKRALIKREHEALEAEKCMFQGMAKPAEDLVRINAGGTIFQTRRSTLCQVSDSLLAKMFSGRWDESLQQDASGAFFLDVSPACFELVLSQLRALTFDPDAGFHDHQVPPGLKQEYDAFLKFMMLLDDTANTQGFGFRVTQVEGDFCGGRTSNWAVASEKYSMEHIEQILSGTLPESTPVDRRAIYCGAKRNTIPSSTISLEFSGRCNLKGCNLMVARECGCRWGIYSEGIGPPIYSGCPFDNATEQRVPTTNLRTLNFHGNVTVQKLRIVIDHLQDNMGFYTISFF